MGNQVTGRVFITINGARIRSKEKAKLNIGGVERTTISGDVGVYGFAEKTVEPKLECTIAHMGDTSLQQLASLTSASIQFETDTGRVFKLREAWLEKPPELTGGEGEVALSFAAISCEEV